MLTGNSEAVSTTSSSSKMVVPVVNEATGSPLTIRLRMQPEWTLPEVNQQLTGHCALATPHPFKLQFEHEGGGADILTDMEDVWDSATGTDVNGAHIGNLRERLATVVL